MNRYFFVLLLGILTGVSPAAAGTKEELIRLQNDVLALTNQIRMLEKTLSEETGSLRSLVAQVNDQLGKSNLLLEKISSRLEDQQGSTSATNQALLKEVQSISSRMDETGTRISALAKQVSDMTVDSREMKPRRFQTLGGVSQMGEMSADTVYTEAFTDFIQGNFDLAIQGFQAFVANFPDSEKADDALYYVGESYFNQGKYTAASESFTKVIHDYPKGEKTASALYKRGRSQMANQQKESAVQDLKTVWSDYPDSPEANLAKAELEKLGIDTSKLPKTSSRRRP